jgi:ribosome maturation factor RimP
MVAMITTERVVKLIEEKIAGSDMFIVHCTVAPGNIIDVALDADTGLAIEACTEVHRHILKNMDREVEDYALVVSSPDLTKPLQVRRQYVKNIGREVSVKTLDNTKTEGTLTNVGEHGIVIHTRTREAVEGKKGKQTVERDIEFKFDQIKETKIVISFK